MEMVKRFPSREGEGRQALGGLWIEVTDLPRRFTPRLQKEDFHSSDLGAMKSSYSVFNLCEGDFSFEPAFRA